jgi:hypothetical protein
VLQQRKRLLRSSHLTTRGFSLALSLITASLAFSLRRCRFDCPVLGLGIVLVGCILAAFVEIPTDFVDDPRNSRRSFIIMCAGVWHNLVLTALGLATAFLFVRMAVFPLIVIQHGVFVVELATVRTFFYEKRSRLV